MRAGRLLRFPQSFLARFGRRFVRRGARFAGDEDGAAAVEFSLVALPFFAMLFAIIETGLVFFSTQILENAVADASRKIYSGEFERQNPGVRDGAALQRLFKDEVCGKAILFDCPGRLKVEITTHARFPEGGLKSPVKDGDIDPDFGGYEAPQRNAFVVVRAAMAQPVFTALMSPHLANLSGNRRLIMATAAFRTEP
ncbi:MAG TPA: TadE/TadG family type IV pilus assembly protein [Microvirga sp.]|jgi:Flp pilus assembly pilin Flp|nr:TadE/TadG family type IV pilus assembly protein [Microvirga sp.]